MKFTIVLLVALAILALASTASASNDNSLKSATHFMDKFVQAPVISDLLKSLADHIDHTPAAAGAITTPTPAPPA
uniref:Uncharacterized protein n=1 Tax=Anopheles christyi TaxID=43041 RepID=A0A182KCQ4_9DIPT